VIEPKSALPFKAKKQLMRPRMAQTREFLRAKSFITQSSAREQRQQLLDDSLARIDAFLTKHF
jgi:hypothetical protein